MTKNGFYKVSESGYSVTLAIFYNPTTDESFSKIVWDNDDDRLLYDEELQELRFEPVNEEISKLYAHRKFGSIFVGDTVEVFKGRKVPVGTIGVVKSIKPYKDRYGRSLCNYVYFDNGTKTNLENCRLVNGMV